MIWKGKHFWISWGDRENNRFPVPSRYLVLKIGIPRRQL